MGPGFGELPQEGVDADVAGRIAAFVPALAPRTRFAIRMGLRAFEWLPFPWRFSRLDDATRADFLARMEESRSSLHHELLLLAKLLFNLGYAEVAAVHEVIGDRIECRLASGGEPKVDHPGGLGDTVAPIEGEQCEVLIVGSGAGGAAAACLLAEAGRDVLVVEAGGSYDRHSYPQEVTEAVRRLYRDGGLTVAEGRPALPIPVGRAVGGTTVVNSGTCFRAPDAVLESWRHEIGIGWAGELEGEFEQAEKFLRVQQLDPTQMGRNGQLAMEGAARLGASGGPISRNAGDCVQCSSCPTGCRLDAKRGMHVSYLPRAVAAGARVRAGVDVRQLIFEGDRCVGAECVVRPIGSEHRVREAETRPFVVRAEQVIVAGGALGTPELLMRSGLGGPAVGRFLHVHPACWIGARYPEPVRGWQGVMQSYFIDQWEDSGLLLEATFTPLAFGGAWLPGTGEAHQRALLDFDRVGSIGVHLSDRSAGRVRLSNDGVRLTYRLTRDDADRLAFGISRAAEVHFAAGAEEVYPNIPGVGTLRRGELSAFESSRLRGAQLRLEAFHPMGTARIDPDPRRGVCAPNGSVHGTRDLYVADASLFPTSLGVNPMMTVIAVANKVAAGMLR